MLGVRGFGRIEGVPFCFGIVKVCVGASRPYAGLSFLVIPGKLNLALVAFSLFGVRV